MGRLPKLTLVLGGARSGKSRHAEGLIAATGWGGVYLATAQALDSEMRQRIAAHRAQRDGHWVTVEEPLDLPGALGRLKPGKPVLIDCLTLWLSNAMQAQRDLAADRAALLAALRACPAPVVAVSNEVGLGIVPDNALGRAFRDAQGVLNQAIAAQADRVVFVAAGLPLVLKG